MSSVNEATYCGLARSVAEQSEPRVRNDDAAIAANEALFPFVSVTLSLEEGRISFLPEGAFVRVNDLVPILQAAQFLLAITQHLLECAVGENRMTINTEEADSDLGILEDRTKKLVALAQGSRRMRMCAENAVHFPRGNCLQLLVPVIFRRHC